MGSSSYLAIAVDSPNLIGGGDQCRALLGRLLAALLAPGAQLVLLHAAGTLGFAVAQLVRGTPRRPWCTMWNAGHSVYSLSVLLGRAF
jgi:type IV secretory pathway TrbD component